MFILYYDTTPIIIYFACIVTTTNHSLYRLYRLVHLATVKLYLCDIGLMVKDNVELCRIILLNILVYMGRNNVMCLVHGQVSCCTCVYGLK